MDLLVEKRTIFGKKTRALRKQGLVPAELYGHGLENLHLSVSAKNFNKVLKETGERSIVNLISDNQKKPVLVHYISRDPVSDAILGVDFYQVRMDEVLRTKVPVKFINESPATKAGGVLVKAIQEIEVEALPDSIPQSFTVDLSVLTEIGKSFHVKDLSLEELSRKNVKILLESGMVIATIKAQITEEQEQVMAETAPTVESIKVETEEKKVEREQKKKTEEEKKP